MKLTPRYTVIYNRPRAPDIVGDHAEVRELGDIETVKRVFLEVVAAGNPDALIRAVRRVLLGGDDSPSHAPPSSR